MTHKNLLNVTAIVAIAAIAILPACGGVIPHNLDDLVGRAGKLSSADKDKKPTDQEATAGLKEALVTGVVRGAKLAAQENGYYGNMEIRIPFPEDFQYVADKVRQVGMGHLVDDFIKQLNRGAERAATKAAPIFKSAITSMTIGDAWTILRGGDNAATQYLERTTSAQLAAEFRPIIKVALDEVHATKHYQRIITAYNRIPLTRDVNPELDDYATQKAMTGLFILVAREEAKIRVDPVARTTELLRKVFDYVSKSA